MGKKSNGLRYFLKNNGFKISIGLLVLIFLTISILSLYGLRAIITKVETNRLDEDLNSINQMQSDVFVQNISLRREALDNFSKFFADIPLFKDEVIESKGFDTDEVISKNNVKVKDELNEVIDSCKKSANLKDLVVVNNDGFYFYSATTSSQDPYIGNLSENEIFLNAKQDKSTKVGDISYFDYDENVFSFLSPIINVDNTINGFILSTIRVSELASVIINDTIFQDAQVLVITNNNKIVCSSIDESIETTTSLLNSADINISEYNESSLKIGENTYQITKSAITSDFMSGEVEWSTITLVEDSIVSGYIWEYSISVLRMSLVVLILLVIVSAIIIVLLFAMSKKDAQLTEKFAITMETFKKYSFEVDPKNRILTFNDRTQKILGFNKNVYSIEELFIDNYIDRETKHNIDARIIPQFLNEGFCEFNMNCPKTSKRINIKIQKIAANKKNKAFVMGVIEDITDLMLSQEILTKKAQLDGLTKLLNRETFVEKVENVLKSNKVARHALYIMDIDDFKQVNDKYGHYIGDILLQKFATTLQIIVDQNNAYVGRLGGDEFAVFVSNISTNKAVEDIAKNICLKLCSVTIADDVDYFLTSSMGVAIYPKHGNDFTTLYQCADNALYESKEVEGSCYTIFDSIEAVTKPITRNDLIKVQGQLIEDNFSLIANVEGPKGAEQMIQILSTAVAGGEFKLFAQPQVSTKNVGQVSCEILSRWNSPVYGLIMPSKFIPLFEKTKRLDILDNYMLAETLKTIESKLKTMKHTLDKVSVNQSISTITNQNYLNIITELIHAYPNAAKHLVIEITERSIFASKRTITKVIKSLRAMDIEVSLDDFGSGYTTLNILKDLSFDELKIDKSFVDSGLNEESKGSVIVEMVTEMAKGLNIRTVAEGVETIDQAKELAKFGVDFLQGFYISRAVSLNEFINKIESDAYNHVTELLIK